MTIVSLAGIAGRSGRNKAGYHDPGAAAVSGRTVASAPVSITMAQPERLASGTGCAGPAGCPERLSGLSIVGVRTRVMLFGSVRTRTAAGSFRTPFDSVYAGARLAVVAG